MTQSRIDAEAIQRDPAASYWLKEAVRVEFKRDPIDAYNDALTLVELTRARMNECLKGDSA